MTGHVPVTFVVGPTACGKSQLAFRLAKDFCGEIINADSIQMYEGLNIGSAKPSLSIRNSLPHHLFDIVKKGETITAGDFRRMALDCLQKVTKNKRAFVVGGSGFYLQALEKGLFEIGASTDQEMSHRQKEFEQTGLKPLYFELKKKDPVAAERIHPSDRYRIIRSLAIMDATGVRLSEIQKRPQPRFPWPVIKMGLKLDRDQLLKRVVDRVEQMWEAGLVQEVKCLIEQDLDEWPALASVGYKETREYLSGLWTDKEWKEQVVQHTMQLAKRQRTWFARDSQIHWFSSEDEAYEWFQRELLT